MDIDALPDWAEFERLMQENYAAGQTLERLKKDMRPLLEAHSAWADFFAADDKFEHYQRLLAVYQAYFRHHYMAMRWDQLREGGFKYWIYRVGDPVNGDCAPDHMFLDGLILPPDHPFWASWFPPNCIGCDCRVFGADSLGGAQRKRGDPAVTLPADWDARLSIPHAHRGLPDPDLRRILKRLQQAGYLP